MARHDTETTHAHNLTEPVYKQVIDLSKAAERYIGTGRFSNTAAALSNIVSEQAIGPHVTINNILLPETRGSLDAEDYVELQSGAKRNMGTVPAQNMLRGVLKVGHRVCTVDKTNPTTMWMSALQQMSSLTPATFTFDFLNRYPAGAPLTKSEIEALKKNKLRPCFSFHKGTDGKVDSVHFSDGALCTGYVQLLDDALRLFKQYFPTLIGKVCTTDYPYTVIPQRIVYDPSRLVKSCFNPVINEAAQIALECEVISPDGSEFGTGFLYLSNPSVYNTPTVPTKWTADNWVFAAVGRQLIWECAAGRKDLPALALIIGCYFFSEDFE